MRHRSYNIEQDNYGTYTLELQMVINTTKELESCEDKGGAGVGTGTRELEGAGDA